METLFALVLTVAMTNVDYQDVILGIYDSQQECGQAAMCTHPHLIGASAES